MPSLADIPELVGFFSYSREDDQGSRGGLSALRDAIQTELSAQLGRSQSDFRIWQDKAAISLGTLWEKQIEQGIKQSVFFIPIVTPRALRSQNCGLEFQSFLAREVELGRDDLVFPILYIPVPSLEDEKLWREDPVLNIVGTRQYLDWRELRHHDPNSTEVRQRIERYCRNISNALHKPWVSPVERRRRQEEEARRQSEEEQRRMAAQLEGERLASQEQRRREAEAARHADEQERAKIAEEQARQRAAEERRRQKAAAEKRAEEEQALAAARRAGTVAAMDAFIASSPAIDLVGEAQQLKTTLQLREEAFNRVMSSNDVAVLRSFVDTYGKGAYAEQIRGRLRLLDPQPARSAIRRAIAVGGVLAAVCISAVVVWLATRASPNTQQVSAAATPPAAQVSAAAILVLKSSPTETKTADTTLAVVPPVPVAPAPMVAPGPKPDERAWSLISDTTDAAAIRRFIAEFPDSPLRRDAEARIAALVEEQTAWSLLKDTKDIDQLRRFIREFPNSADRAEAEQRLALLSAAAPTALPVSAPDAHELARALQFELMRVGCFNGTVNGLFDDGTKAAWHRFIKFASISLPDDASSAAINAVRGINKRVCPVVCPHGQHAEDGSCVADAPRPSKRTVVRSAPAPQPAAQGQPKSNGYCQEHTAGGGELSNSGVLCR
jgi:hypothetical protein